MKRSIYLFLLFTATICISCKKEAKNYTLGIDVQSEFVDDSVEVFIDNESLIKKRLSTNPLLGVCSDGQLRLTKKEGTHTLLVIVNNSATFTSNFTLNNDLYIGVTYNATDNEVFWVHSNEPFLYE